MPRVVPSDVVAAIERMFPWVMLPGERDRNRHIGIGHSERVAAIVSLVQQVLDELVTLGAEDYVALVCATAAARHQTALWESGLAEAYSLGPLHGFEPRTPVVIIRDCFALCRDEAPSSDSVELTFIPDADLRESIRLDISAANRDLANGEWKGATVLAGAAVEALLLWAIQQHEQQHAGSIAGAGVVLVAAGTLGQPPNANPERWDLHEYVEVSEHLQLIEPETAAQARQARSFRNFIHPGRAARLGQKCDRGTALSALAAVELIVRDLTP